MAKSPVRFGLTGSGFMGRTHAEAIRRLPESSRLLALWGGTRAPALAERYGAACAPSLEALMDRTDLDAVVVTTPHHRHAHESALALAGGRSVLIEKPMATTVADCDRLMTEADKRRLTIGLGYHQRFRMNNVKARELIQAGAIGRPHTAQVIMPLFRAGAGAQFGGTWQWWDDPRSVGHLFNAAPHAIDLMRWMTGAEVVSVSAFCRTFTPGLQVEDTTLALMEFSNGMLFSFFSTNALPAPAFPSEDFRFRIMGSKGLLDILPVGEMRLESGDGQGWRVVNNQPATNYTLPDAAFGDTRMQCYRDQMQAFLDGMGGAPLRCGSAADGRAAVSVCAAMLRSSRERRWVTPD